MKGRWFSGGRWLGGRGRLAAVSIAVVALAVVVAIVMSTSGTDYWEPENDSRVPSEIRETAKGKSLFTQDRVTEEAHTEFEECGFTDSDAERLIRDSPGGETRTIEKFEAGDGGDPKLRGTLEITQLGLGIHTVRCGGKTDVTPLATPLKVMLDFFPNAVHAGIYAALANGDYRRAGLDVKLHVPTSAATLARVAAGDVDLAISSEPDLLLARDRGLPVVSVAALVQQPLASIISLPSAGIRSVADLEGKRVGTVGSPLQSAYLRTVLERAGIDPGAVRRVDVGFNLVPAIVDKRVDAALGPFWNQEGVQLALARKRPRIIRLERAGVPTYNELIVVAKDDAVQREGARIRAFLQALAHGHEALRRDPARAIDVVLDANRSLDRRLLQRSLRETLSAFFPADDSGRFGYQDPRAWGRYGRWMLEHRLVRRAPQIGSALTNELLPGNGA